MRREARLESLVQKASRRALLLRVLTEGLRPPVSKEQDRLLTFVTIEALNLWSLFCRSMFLSAALGSRDGNGVKITCNAPGIATEDDALTLAIHTAKPRLRGKSPPWIPRDEPPWHEPVVFLSVMQALGPTNLVTVQNAFSYPTQVFSYLPTARNFYAHRAANTAAKVRGIARGYALSPRLRPSELLATRPAGRPQAIVADWLDDLRNIMLLAL